MLVALLPLGASAQDANLPTTDDPRVGLAPGFEDAGEAGLGMDLVGTARKRDGVFFNPNNLGDFAVANSDLAFTGDHAIQGNFSGFSVYNIAGDTPQLVTQVVCPGGQGDATVIGDLLFTSVEQTNGRIDCGTQGTGAGNVPNPDRMRGVRVWDISDIANPVQVAVVQTCRGSHTHRLVEDPNDPTTVYIYNNGTNAPRPAGEGAGFCKETPLTDQPVTDQDASRWKIEVIEVPLANPAAARIVNEVRLFADEATGALNGLNNTLPGTQHPCASSAQGCGASTPTAYSPLPNTNTCHDITVYPAVGLAAGACQGNGLLIDISDPANPVRIDAVSDPNFSYWHSANFNNDGTQVMFTDEWGGGTGARCRATDRLEWGANALFEIVEVDGAKQLEFKSYYKMPAVQTAQENCVAHQANIVPVPGRDIIVQAWYQGGISMFDWTDPANPFEIGYFDRGPISPTATVLGGFWSGYWYNGSIYGAEIARGLDTLKLTPTADLTANEIAAAETFELAEHNAMSMRPFVFTASFPLAQATLDQLIRAEGIEPGLARRTRDSLDKAERFAEGPQRRAAVAQLDSGANQLRNEATKVERRGSGGDAAGLRGLADSMTELADTLR
jgi:hypothetical protein